MRIQFWGVRGSIPTPDPRNAGYGGNTTCVEARLRDGSLIILDGGSGLRALGKRLTEEAGERPIKASFFLTHFHWDHIQGIPFFIPLYRRGNRFIFHSVLRTAADLKDTIEGQMMNPYFPVNMEMMAAQRRFQKMGSKPVRLGGATIRFARVNHPQGCVAYRIEAEGAAFVFSTDHEPGVPAHDRALAALAAGADVLVYDAQYTPEQLAGEKKHWGHGSWLNAVRTAQASGAKKLILFHHDPDNDDAYIDGLVRQARQEFPETWAANEGLSISLPGGELTGARTCDRPAA